MKKMFTFILALMAGVGMMMAEKIAGGPCGANVTWSLNDKGVLTISGTGSMSNWITVLSPSPWYSEYRTSITSIVIEDGVTSIGSAAFYYCTALKSVYIPYSVTSIGEAAFASCSALTSISLHHKITSIGDQAFGSCSALTAINVAINNDYYSSVDGVLFNKDTTRLMQCPGAKTGIYTIPNTVATIDGVAFANCTFLRSLIIPNSVTIKDYAFSNCSGLKSIVSLAAIPPTCKANCFTDVPNDIPVYVLKASLEDYNNSDWSYFTNIQPVVAAGTCGDNLEWRLSEEGVLTISGAGKMTNWSSSTEVPWNDNRSSIKSLEIGYSVTRIGDLAFSGCSNITAITIPASIASIGTYAIACAGLKSITCESATPPTCDDDCFYGVDKDIPVHVPAGAADTYNDAEGWNYFSNIQEPFDPAGKITYGLVDLSKETLTEGQYLIVFDDNKAHALVGGSQNKDLIACSNELVILDDVAYLSPKADTCAVTIAPFGTDSFSIKLADKTYLDLQVKNSVTFASAATGFAITDADNGDQTVEIAKYLASENKTYVLKQNDDFFRMYSNNMYTLPKLYRKKSDTPTGLEEINDQMRKCENEKIIIDGQLFILRDGKTFTVTGQEVR